MLKPMLAALALGVSTPSPQPPTAAEMAVAQVEAVDDVLSMTSLPVTVEMSWLPCGQENAFYSPDDNHIFMCLEIEPDDGPSMIAAHEAGHALVAQLGLEIDGDPYANERAADEIGALAMIDAGQLDQIVGNAKWFMRLAQEEGDGDDGQHPPFMARVRELLLMVDGAENGSPSSRAFLAYTRARWAGAIHDAETRFWSKD